MEPSTNITQEPECYECGGTHNLQPALFQEKEILLCEYCRGEMECVLQMLEYWNRYTLI